MRYPRMALRAKTPFNMCYVRRHYMRCLAHLSQERV